MKNKKKFIFIALIMAVLIFVAMYFIYNYREPNILDSNDKQWITENSGKVIDMAVINDIPLYANNGTGIVFDFLDYVTEQSGLEFNKIPYLKDGTPSDTDYKFELLDGDVALSSNQLLIYNDSYIVLSKKDIEINSINDIAGMTIGLRKSDISNVNYYLKSVNTIKYKEYSSVEAMISALEKNEVNSLIIPNIMYLDNIILSKYCTNYFFMELSKNFVLTLSENNTSLNKILVKAYNKWFSDYFTADYNKIFLDYYINKNDINDKTKADLLSKTYVYGYVDNSPYEVEINNGLAGIAIEYIDRLIRLTDIDINYVKYQSVDELEKAIVKGDVDIYFNYFNSIDDKYLQTKSTFVEKYVILAQIKDNYYVNTLESLKGKNVNMLSNNSLHNFIKDNSMANIALVDKTSDLTKNNNIIVVDKEVYTYYKNNYFKDYEILYEDIMTNDYNFMIKGTNESFYNLFNYTINANSYQKYRSLAYINLNASIFERISFEELYLVILAIIFIPMIVIVCVILIIKNRKKLKLVRREDRKKYTDMLTSLKNRNYLNLNIDKWNENKIYPQTIIIIDLNNVKYVNDNYGREKGDMLIVRAASTLVNMQLEKTEIIRSDGNEFLIYLLGYSENQIDIYVQKLSKALKELPYGFGAAIGRSMIVDDIKTIDDAINEATIEMQSDKESYR